MKIAPASGRQLHLIRVRVLEKRSVSQRAQGIHSGSWLVDHVGFGVDAPGFDWGWMWWSTGPYSRRVSDLDGLSREELLAALAERDAVIAALLAEIERLKRRVGMDSSNSSMPPGSDGPAARAKRAKRKRKPSPRGRGGQTGREGHGLQRVANPDRVEVVAPRGCGGCGQSLVGVPGRVVSRIQVFDTPPVTLDVTEYQLLAVACPGCAVVTRASAPDGGAWAVLLRPERARGDRVVGLQRAHERRTRRRSDGRAAGRTGVDRVHRLIRPRNSGQTLVA
jgi:hypothetical protein